MRLRRLLGVTLIVLALVLAGAGAALALFLNLPQGDESTSMVLHVEKGQSTREIAEQLADAGVVRPAWFFARLVQLAGVDRQLVAGDYLFEGRHTPREILSLMREGRIITVSVTLPEGRDLYESARLIAEAGIAQEASLLAAFKDPALVSDIDPEADDLEGYLFPDTYRFARGVSAEAVARELVGTFRERFLEEHGDRLASQPRPLRDVLTIASLVEEETGLGTERPLIAGVFIERLERGMRLQCDPTIIYGLKREGRWDGNIRRADLTWEHPYNTYVIRGLPPGPISSPGLASLLAVLDPKNEGYLYFVSRNDGSHHFSRTLAEHNAAVRRYQLRRR